MTRRIWDKISKTTTRLEPYKTGSGNVKKLMPENESALFFTASVAGLHGNNTFLENLHEGKKLRVHRATITSMSKDTVVLNEVGGAIFATGWTYNTDLFDPRVSSIPTSLTAEDPLEAKYWADLHTVADREVIERLPILKQSPISTTYQRPLTRTPFRLYRYILPTSPAHLAARDLIFMGLLTNTQTAIYDEVSALWGVSYLEGLRDVPPKEEMDADIARVNAWCARRYLGRGKSSPIASTEVQDVIDTMMRDLGLPERRKSGTLANWFVPYRAQDYKGIVEDFMKGNTVW